MRLGRGADYDFFLPTLLSHTGQIRNVIDVASARNSLAMLTPRSAEQIQSIVQWMPDDVIEEIMRFTADFMDLKPAVVHAWQDAMSISAGYAAHLVGVPRIVLAGRNMAPWRFPYFRPYMLHAYRELFASPAVTMLNNSNAGRIDYARWLEVPEEGIHVLRNGIREDIIASVPHSSTTRLRTDLGIPSHAPIVGSIFRFYGEKRPILWVEAAARIANIVPDCHFVVFGKGPLQQEAARVAAARGIGNRWHTPGTTADPALALSVMDVFLLTSEFEGTPNVVLEAGLAGVPVIATDAGGTREAIAQGGTGYVVDVADPDQIAAITARALADSAWRQTVRTSGPAFVKEWFGLKRMIDETLDIYQIAGSDVSVPLQAQG